MIGTWKGTYMYESKRMPEARRKKATNFTIIITEFDGVNFSGEVQDDIETGGTRGKGIITGFIKQNRISFEKRMPIQTVRLQDGTIKEEEKPHLKIYYTGEIYKTSITGTWKLKLGFGKKDNKWALFLPIKGKWAMSKEMSQ